MAFSRVNGTSESASSNSAAPALGTVTLGNWLVLTVTLGDATTTITSVSDSTGNTFVLLKDDGGINGLHVLIYLLQNASAGTHTVTINLSGTIGHSCWLQEFSGGVTTGTVLDKQNAAQGNSTSPSSGSVVTAVTNALGVGAGRFGASEASITQGTGWALRNTQTRGIFEDQVNITSGSSVTADCTIGTLATWNMMIVDLSDTAIVAGGTGPTYRDRNTNRTGIGTGLFD